MTQQTPASPDNRFAAIAPLLEGQAIELPSWAFGNSGTRFKVFGSPGSPRTIEEKIADAATVHARVLADDRFDTLVEHTDEQFLLHVVRRR